MCLKELRDEFLYDCECRHLAKGSLRNYRASTRFLLEFLERKQITELEDVRPRHLRDLMKEKQDAGNIMLKIFDNYYLDASSVCYMLKKAHVKGDGKLEYDVCTYHTRLEEALAEAVRRGLREGVASEKLTEWEQLCGEFRRLKSEVQGLLESISPADKALDLALKNGNNCA